MPRIYGDHVSGPESVRQANDRLRGLGGGGLAGDVLEACRAGIVAVALAQKIGDHLRHELKRQIEGVACDPDRIGQRLELAAEEIERRADQEPERLAGDGHVGPSLVQLQRAA